MKFSWILIIKLILFQIIYLNYVLSTLRWQLPLQRLACPVLLKKSTENKDTCQQANTACHFDNSVSANYSTCNYMTDVQKVRYNVALGKVTEHSSSVTGRESWKAVNGCNKDYINDNTFDVEEAYRTCCFHSLSETNSQPWWSVNLTSEIPVISVIITADTNSSMEVTVSVFNNSVDQQVTCTNSETFTGYQTKTMQCTGNIIGRNVIIQLAASSTQKFLSLCDVQVETVGLFNAALGRATWQSSTLFYLDIDGSAYKNVDGSLSNEFWLGQCSHTDGNDKNPWWSVDLGQIMTVYSVTLVNKGDGHRRLKSLSISVSNHTNIPALYVCGTHQSQIPNGTSINILCREPVNARYVIVQKQNDLELVMCEVLVEAACPGNRFGRNCWQNCHCRNQTSCNRITGQCPGGLCDKGYMGEKCDTACPYNKYGEQCMKDCHCKDKASCDSVDGTCPRALCEKGYKGEQCSTECSNHFGYNCLNPCHCRNNMACSRIDGICTNDECIAGFYGKNCSMGCPYNTYGENCINSCHCRNKAACNSVTGECPNGLCERGYEGSMCNAGCTNGKFGYNCKDLCNCFNNRICNRVDGSCPSGLCALGYRGINCSFSCMDGNYGANCRYICHNCRNNAICNKRTGHCPSGECEKGYHGSKCDKVCNNTFGYNCQHPCRCRNGEKCYIIDGRCPSGECMPGFHGANCSTDCPAGFYGNNCSSVCSKNCATTCDKNNGHCVCKSGFKEDICDTECPLGNYGVSCRNNCSQFCRPQGICNQFNGHCLLGQCISGYTGLKCDQSCPAGKYGLDCQRTCHPNCRGPCDVVNGACLVGCEDGWTGEKCDIEQSNITPIISIVVPTVGVIILVTVCLVAAYLFIKLRQTSDHPHEDHATETRKSADCVKPGSKTQQAVYYNVTGNQLDTNRDSSNYCELSEKYIHAEENQPYEQLNI